MSAVASGRTGGCRYGRPVGCGQTGARRRAPLSHYRLLGCHSGVGSTSFEETSGEKSEKQFAPQRFVSYLETGGWRRSSDVGDSG